MARTGKKKSNAGVNTAARIAARKKWAAYEKKWNAMYKMGGPKGWCEPARKHQKAFVFGHKTGVSKCDVYKKSAKTRYNKQIEKRNQEVLKFNAHKRKLKANQRKKILDRMAAERRVATAQQQLKTARAAEHRAMKAPRRTEKKPRSQYNPKPTGKKSTEAQQWRAIDNALASAVDLDLDL